MKGIITAVQDTQRTWNNPNTGKLHYYWTVQFQDGSMGEAGTLANPQDKWVVGAEVEYNSTPNGTYAAKLQLINPEFAQQNGQPNGAPVLQQAKPQAKVDINKSIERQSAFKSACMFYAGREVEGWTGLMDLAELGAKFIADIKPVVGVTEAQAREILTSDTPLLPPEPKMTVDIDPNTGLPF